MTDTAGWVCSRSAPRLEKRAGTGAGHKVNLDRCVYRFTVNPCHAVRWCPAGTRRARIPLRQAASASRYAFTNLASR
jgi:hypothetical protein